MHYVMECAEMTLNDVKQISLYQYKSILFQILFGLHVAQKTCEFVHNDLHSKNVLLSKSETHLCFTDGEDAWFTHGYSVKITDFGLSRIRLGENVIYNPRNPMTELFDPSADVDKVMQEMSRIKMDPERWVEDPSLSPQSKRALSQEKKKTLDGFRKAAKTGVNLSKLIRHSFFDDLRTRPEAYSTPEKMNVDTNTPDKADAFGDKENTFVLHGSKTVSTPFKFKM